MASLSSSRQPPAGKRPRSPTSPASSSANIKRQKTTTPALPSDFFSPVSSMPIEPTATPAQALATAAPDLEAEWAAFEAEVVASPPPSAQLSTVRALAATAAVTMSAPPMRNPPPGEELEEREKQVDDDVQGEKDEAQQKLLEEFEEMESLEQRVRRLKARREELKQSAPKPTVMMEIEDRGSLKTGAEANVEAEDDEEDDEEDTDFFLRR